MPPFNLNAILTPPPSPPPVVLTPPPSPAPFLEPGAVEHEQNQLPHVGDVAPPVNIQAALPAGVELPVVPPHRSGLLAAMDALLESACFDKFFMLICCLCHTATVQAGKDESNFCEALAANMTLWNAIDKASRSALEMFGLHQPTI